VSSTRSVGDRKIVNKCASLRRGHVGPEVEIDSFLVEMFTPTQYPLATCTDCALAIVLYLSDVLLYADMFDVR
jgi:hypothetical protein